MTKFIIHINQTLVLAFFLGALPLFAQTEPDSASECDDFVLYTVKAGDTISSISIFLGSEQFEEILYRANSDNIHDKDMLRAGLELKIPINIAQYKKSGLSLEYVLNNPSCRPVSEVSEEDAQSLDDEEALNKFREAFRELTSQEADTAADQSHVKAEKKILTGISGMVIDETRSKIGRDFYDVFYQNWTAPEEVSGFTITITEQPAPGLGTIISVKTNDTETFKYRLQPRYDFIQQAAQYAVRLTYNHLKNNPQDFVIY